eukprot:COSAG01_NODE_62348_length_285_cov_0.731183_1_plen_56_part_01
MLSRTPATELVCTARSSGRYIVYFTGLWAHFDAIDRNHDGRLDAHEFLAGCRYALS